MVWSVLMLLLAGVYAASVVSPYRTTFFSGWFLFVLILALAMFNFLKRFVLVPLETSIDWFQFHVSAGLLTLVLFVLHIGLRIPNGSLEVTLALLFTAGSGSGIMGLLLSGALSRRLATRGKGMTIERIPVERKQIRKRVEDIVERTVVEVPSTVLLDFHEQRLATFLDGPRNYWGHLFSSLRPCRALLNDLEALDPHLSEKERKSVEEVRDLICVKDDLDHQEALRRTLRYWLFVHVPLAYSLLILALVHAIVVSMYTTGGTGS